MQLMFRSPIAYVTMLVFLLVCAPSMPGIGSVDFDAVERAVSLLERGDAVAARTTLTGSRQPATPPDALDNTAEGIIELAANRYAAAEERFRAAIVQDPQQSTALWGLSLCLLQRGCAFEAATLVDRAAIIAPANTRIKVLQAYIYSLLGRTKDAITIGKTAMDLGEKSPFLFAVLAQTHRQMGYAQKALAFGSLAAKYYYGLDYLAHDTRVTLPLTMVITDTPRALSNIPDTTDPPASPNIQRTEMEIEVPALTPSAVATQKALRILSPQAGSALRGVQQVQVAYTSERQVRFLIFTVDNVLRGLTTELPYRFLWDADDATPGEHVLSVRTYDQYGMVVDEDSIPVTTVAGKSVALPEMSARAVNLQQRMIDLTMPSPTPLSLFTQLGWWYRDVGESAQAIVTLEKAAAIDPTAEGVLPALIGLYQTQGCHPLSPTGEIIRGPANGKKRVALTFDDGPNPLYTPSILSVLQRYNARATFFVVGKMALQYPDLTLQMLTEGHELGNHSYTHPNITKLSRDELIAEVLRTRSVIKDITGQPTYLFRPPGGNIDPLVTRELRALDYNIIYWDINAGEYRNNTPEDQAAQMLARVKDGSILLLHNGPVDGTLNILPTLMAELNKRGFTFVTVTELMKEK